MILEVLDLVTEWLAGPQGINAQLAAIPMTPGDTRPDPLEGIFTTHRNVSLAQGELPPAHNFAVVTFDGPFDVDPQAPVQTRIVPSLQLAISYVTRNAVSEVAVRDGLYVMRAIERSLELFIHEADESAKERSGIVIMAQAGLRKAPVHEAIDDATVLAEVVVTYTVRDTLPR